MELDPNGTQIREQNIPPASGARVHRVAWTSPFAHAQALIAKAGTWANGLIPALNDTDEATAARAAGLVHEATREIEVPAQGDATIELQLQRWFDPAAYRVFGGDHPIHAAVRAHDTSPPQGIHLEDVFLQDTREGLNVGCVLTWGPCHDFQRIFFCGHAAPRSSPTWR